PVRPRLERHSRTCDHDSDPDRQVARHHAGQIYSIEHMAGETDVGKTDPTDVELFESVPLATSARMSLQRSEDTEPEMVLRRRLHAMGLRYRVHMPVPGLPRRRVDIMFTRARVAVFV